MATISNNNKSEIIMYDNDNIVHADCVTYDQVQWTKNIRNPGKSDCMDGMLSDSLKNGTKNLNMLVNQPK